MLAEKFIIRTRTAQTDDAALAEVSIHHADTPYGSFFSFERSYVYDGTSKRRPGDIGDYALGHDLAVVRALDKLTDAIRQHVGEEAGPTRADLENLVEMWRDECHAITEVADLAVANMRAIQDAVAAFGDVQVNPVRIFGGKKGGYIAADDLGAAFATLRDVVGIA